MHTAIFTPRTHRYVRYGAYGPGVFCTGRACSLAQCSSSAAEAEFAIKNQYIYRITYPIYPRKCIKNHTSQHSQKWRKSHSVHRNTTVLFCFAVPM